MMFSKKMKPIGFLLLIGLLLNGIASPSLRAEGPLAVTVMTLNLHNGKDRDGAPNLERFIELINVRQPDLIALQEVERNHVQRFQAEGYRVVSGMNANLPFFRFGNVILTKHRLVYQRHLYLPSSLEQRGINEVALEINGHYFRVINLHLGLGRAEQKQQLDEILKITRLLPEPLIIMGDFNLEPSHVLLKNFPYRHVGAVFPLPATFPAPNPRYLIDLIWYSPHWHPLAAEVLSWDGSDHFPVIAQLELKEPSTVPLTAVAIPDFTRENNPLLPDPGEPFLEIGAGVNRTKTGTEIIGEALFTWDQKIFLDGSYDGRKPVYTLGINRLFDLRDYFSLMGVRGKALWSFSVSKTEDLKPWYTWSQYYHWNSRWGTKLAASTRENGPKWILEELYLPAPNYRCSLKLDTEKSWEIGLAVSPLKRQVFEIKWGKKAEDEIFSVGWHWSFNSPAVIE